MEKSKFYTQLFFVSILSLILMTVCYQLMPIEAYIDLGIIALVFFIGLSLLIFSLAEKAAVAKNLNAFTHLIMYNLMLKLFLSVFIVVIYYYIVKPSERLFIVPYFVVYLIFTIFEAYFLSNQAKSK